MSPPASSYALASASYSAKTCDGSGKTLSTLPYPPPIFASSFCLEFKKTPAASNSDALTHREEELFGTGDDCSAEDGTTSPAEGQIQHHNGTGIVLAATGTRSEISDSTNILLVESAKADLSKKLESAVEQAPQQNMLLVDSARSNLTEKSEPAAAVRHESTNGNFTPKDKENGQSKSRRRKSKKRKPEDLDSDISELPPKAKRIRPVKRGSLEEPLSYVWADPHVDARSFPRKASSNTPTVLGTRPKGTTSLMKASVPAPPFLPTFAAQSPAPAPLPTPAYTPRPPASVIPSTRFAHTSPPAPPLSLAIATSSAWPPVYAPVMDVSRRHIMPATPVYDRNSAGGGRPIEQNPPVGGTPGLYYNPRNFFPADQFQAQARYDYQEAVRGYYIPLVAPYPKRY